eukprot:COSAG01_NODE_7713_length_3088_cov_1.991971_3_plen_51_part_00
MWNVRVHGWVFNTPAEARLDPDKRWIGATPLFLWFSAVFSSTLWICTPSQ